MEDKTVLFSNTGNSWTVAEDFATVVKRLNANILIMNVKNVSTYC